MILTASSNADCLLGSQNDVATIGLLIERGADSNAAKASVSWFLAFCNRVITDRVSLLTDTNHYNLNSASRP